MQSIGLVTKEPNVLPAVSEELIHDARASINLYVESPSSGNGIVGNSSGGGSASGSIGGGSIHGGGGLNTAGALCANSIGSRKSSVCSISSMNSSGSSNSPGHAHYPRSVSQVFNMHLSHSSSHFIDYFYKRFVLYFWNVCFLLLTKFGCFTCVLFIVYYKFVYVFS